MIHNHFIIKSLHLTHPGGLVAVITSRFTLDARDPGPRREMAALADLVGAVRLPEGTFRASSGTDVVVDLLLLRRRASGAGANGEAWATLEDVATHDGDVAINRYLARHRELILGELRATSGQYNQADNTVRPLRPLREALDPALTQIVEQARTSGLAWASPIAAAATQRSGQADLAGVVVGAQHHEGSILRTPGGGFAIVQSGLARPFEPRPRSDFAELGALVDLRDALTQTLEAQASSRDDAAFADAQRLLNVRYDAYVARYGALNRFRLVRTGRLDPETGEERFRRINPRMGGFGADPDFFSVLALERFDPDLQQATKAAIFSERVVALRQPPLGAETAQDALAICLDTFGRVELDTIAELLGVARGDARAELGTLVYDDPAVPDSLVPASAYLSGNVRAKLAAAEAAAANADLEVNVTALRAMLPADLGPEEIDARLGAPWIGADDVAAFAQETLGSHAIKVEYSPAGSLWAATCPSWERGNVRMTSTWGTRRADAIALLQHSLQQRPVTVYDSHDDGTRSVNAEETLTAREKQDALEQRFRAWVWEEPARAQRLAGRYNELFNSTVLPAYDGSHLSTPGLAADFHPHRHQLDAVWRIVSEPTVLLAHCVGAGKTASMVMAGMELRRLGLTRRPAYVVPNLLLRCEKELLVMSLWRCGGRCPHTVGSDDPNRPTMCSRVG